MSSTTQRSKEWRPFRRRPKKQNFFCVCATKKNRRERDTTEKEKSPNCLMYHYKKRGFKKKKDTIHTQKKDLFFFGRSEVVSLFVLRKECFLRCKLSLEKGRPSRRHRRSPLPL